MDTNYNAGKFRALVHYVCAQAPSPLSLGATKLNKILWYAERDAYLRLGAPVSGARFIKLKYGPVPEAIDDALNALSDTRLLVIRDTEYNGKPKREFLSLQDPSLAEFSTAEVSIINHAIQSICTGHTADSISKVSHDEIWDLARIGEEMPFHAAFGRRGVATPADISWANHQLSTL